MNAQKIDKWQRTVARLNEEITRLHHDRRLWRMMMDALSNRPGAEFFQAHYTRLYADRSVAAVRRIVFGLSDPKSVALDRLLDDIAENPESLSRHRHADLFGDTVFGREYGEEHFDAIWGDGSGGLDVKQVLADRQRVVDAAKEIKAFADRTVAHIDKRGYDGTIRFADLDTAIDAIGAVFGKFQELITGSSAHKWEPTVQGDWAAPFRSALFTPDEDV